MMLVGMVTIIFVGFPISFTLLFVALVFGSFGLGIERTIFLLYLQIYGTMKDDILPAVPLFIFMGFMTEQAGLMNRLFETMRNILAPVRGSLYLAVLMTATIFAMATGIVGAAVTVLGIMAGPMMVKYGYDTRLSAGAITAGGTLGILIPPSIMLLVMAPVLGVPANYMYSGAFGPGFLLASLYIAYCLVRSFINPKLGPPVPRAERVTDVRRLFLDFVSGVVPLTVLIGVTLGTILVGAATATEAASCGAAGATILAMAYRKLTLQTLKAAGISTLLTSSMVLFLCAASNVFGSIFTLLGGADLITSGVLSMTAILPDTGKLLFIMAIIFLLGWPFEWPVIVLVFLPMFLPSIEALNFGMSKPDMMLWFGILIAVNMQTAFLSPPVAMSAYFLKNVMPSWSLSMIFRGMGQFMVIQVICLVAMIFWPDIALWLPRALK
ncbi:C4-dicarboxylate ABC transporter permease [Betaproteobacteria bacterium]|nr:C4-dicarboxylate ABC transporter permease [Betaproteobacteria bacterium]